LTFPSAFVQLEGIPPARKGWDWTAQTDDYPAAFANGSIELLLVHCDIISSLGFARVFLGISSRVFFLGLWLTNLQ
jgi:hypothetical protein